MKRNLSLLEKRFWNGWEERFLSESHRFITPNDPLVRREVSKLSIEEEHTDIQKAKRAWGHVYTTIDYRLSKEWKIPRQTIQEGIGDCEDLTFLLASMFSAMGIRETKIHIGKMVRENGREEDHTWNTVNGVIVDGTGSQSTIRRLEYKTISKIKISTNG